MNIILGLMLAGKKKLAGWIPDQHGAWAMLILPLIVGLVFAVRESKIGLHHISLAGFWVFGYGCFHAFSLWFKSAASRRARFIAPIVSYLAISVLCGFITLLLEGFGYLYWAPIFIFLFALIVVGIYFREEKSVLVEGSLVLAACLFGLVQIYSVPQETIVKLPENLGQLTIFGLLFGYFFSTIFLVKTVVRKRGKKSWLIWSWWIHTIFFITTFICALTQIVNWGWLVFGLLVLGSGFFFPLQIQLGKSIRPAQVGVFEMVLSLIALLLALL